MNLETNSEITQRDLHPIWLQGLNQPQQQSVELKVDNRHNEPNEADEIVPGLTTVLLNAPRDAAGQGPPKLMYLPKKLNQSRA